MSRARIAAFVVLFGSIFAYEIHRLFVVDYGTPRVTAAGRTTLLELGGARTVAQTMLLDAEGFDGVTLHARADHAGPRGDVVIELFEELPGEARLIHRTAYPAEALVREPAFHVAFPPIADSRGRLFRLQLGAPGVPRGESVALVANLTDQYFDGLLFVDDREQWGDLVFAASARRASAPWRLARLLPGDPGWPGWWMAGAGLFLAWNLLLAYACLVAVGLAGVGPAANLDGRQPTAAPRARRRATPTLAAARAWFAALLVVLLVVAARPQPTDEVIDLLDRFPEAEKDTELGRLHHAFLLTDVSILGERKPALREWPPSAARWRVDLPPDAWFLSDVAFAPETWSLPSDGADFIVEIVEAGETIELARWTIAPSSVPEQRRWLPVSADLQPWGGRTVELVLRTDPGAAGNAVNDACLWGAPRIVAPRRADDRPARGAFDAQ